MNNVNLQVYSFGFDTGLSFLDKLRKAGELGLCWGGTDPGL